MVTSGLLPWLWPPLFCDVDTVDSTPLPPLPLPVPPSPVTSSLGVSPSCSRLLVDPPPLPSGPPLSLLITPCPETSMNKVFSLPLAVRPILEEGSL